MIVNLHGYVGIYNQVIQSGGSIHAINLLTSALFTVNVIWSLLKYTEQNVNNQTLTQASQLYIFMFSFVLR